MIQGQTLPRLELVANHGAIRTQYYELRAPQIAFPELGYINCRNQIVKHAAQFLAYTPYCLIYYYKLQPET